MDSGQYSSPFRWHSLADGEGDDYASASRIPTDNGVVWGRFEVPSSTREGHMESPTNTLYGTVYLREWIGVKNGHTLTDLEMNRVYEVLSVAKDRFAYETICELKGLR